MRVERSTKVFQTGVWELKDLRKYSKLMCESWKRFMKVFQTDVWELREIYESIPNWYVVRVERDLRKYSKLICSESWEIYESVPNWYVVKIDVIGQYIRPSWQQEDGVYL